MEEEKLVEEIFNSLKLKFDSTKNFIEICVQAIKRFDKKQEIFSSENITDWGLIGVASKLSHYLLEVKKYLSIEEDKRIELGLTDDKINKDFIDMGIYSFIALLLMSNKIKK